MGFNTIVIDIYITYVVDVSSAIFILFFVF